MDLAPRYQPSQVESKWYDWWKEKEWFRPRFDPNRPSFSMVLPPPNVTGVLHVGHALNHTWQDILVRYHRMRGDNTLWLPGTDHAGISTQIKVEEQLRASGQSRFDVGRDAFEAAVWRFKDENGGEILRQLGLLGSSVDWSRLRFTLEPTMSRAVIAAFVQLYDQGLIYRGDYLINWCVSCGTALSDIEVDHQEREGQLTYIRYPLKGGADFVTVATTRPETLLGDTAVAVHPDDVRYQKWLGQSLIVPLTGREVPLIADRAVDPEFGTGAVKVTPAHDPNDFAMGERHRLPSIAVIGEDGCMTQAAGPYQGLDRLAARRQVLLDLEASGAMVRQENIVHAVGHCEKCGSVIEPLVSRQWFVRMKPLVAPAIAAVDRGIVRFEPSRFTKGYRHWMENIHDWCISRQLWWGHRIPAYYCEQGHVTVAADLPDGCAICDGPVVQDPDVLDTWFSSALWPFSTLGWPDLTEDLARYYPTSVLCTGWDIIPFWVSRMITEGIHFTGQVPFETVLINGLVRDSQGRKMSKSLGNGVNPVAMIERYGADALRLALVLGSAPGNDIRFSEEKVESAMHFANKVYNAVRFVLMNLGDPVSRTVSDPGLHPTDVWIQARLNAAIMAVTSNIERFEFGEAARAIYDFFWDEFCDWYIELAKVRLRSDAEADRAAARITLVAVAKKALALLHPFMPFVTEELWQALPDPGDTIMLAEWPEPHGVQAGRVEWAVARLIALTRTVRNLRAELNLPPGQAIQLEAVSDDSDTLAAWQLMAPELQSLAKVERVTFGLRGQHDRPRRAIAGVTEGGIAYLPLEGVVDLDRERERLEKSAQTSQAELSRVEARLADASFVAKAPSTVVEASRARVLELKGRLERVEERLRDLT